jgi:hypothetical protein
MTRLLGFIAAVTTTALVGAVCAGGAVAATHHRRAHAGASRTPSIQVKYVFDLVEVHPGNGGVVVPCPAHYYPISGGYENPASNESPKIRIVASFPYSPNNKPPTEWAFNLSSEESGPVTITFSATCLSGIRVVR